MRTLARFLPDVDGVESGKEVVTSYWVAEDDRIDRSDCDSAVFVTPGKQAEASQVLLSAGLTQDCNLVTRDSRFS